MDLNKFVENLTLEQQKIVFDSIKDSVSQARQMQRKKVAENVDIVLQALKKIDSDIRERYDLVGNQLEKRISNIKDGRDGTNGRDGRDGKDGKPGKDGKQGPAGRDGKDGKNGVDGLDGVSVISANIDFDGSLIIKLSNGKEINVGEVVPMDLAERIKIIGNGGGTSQTVLDTLDSLQTQINNLIPSQTGNSGKYLTTNGSTLSWASIAGGGLSYQGTWNASTNSPTLVSSTGTNGYYYVVGTSGSTNLDGITDWVAGDWALFNGTVWQKIDQTNLVSSVNGQTGAVSLTTSNISEGSNLYYTDARARSALSAGTGISYNSTTGQISNTYQGTVTSVAMTVPTGLSVSGTPVTSSGTLAISFTTGYSIPTNTSQTNWDTAYTDRLKWDGGSTGLDAATGRTSLGLGTIATQAASNVSITGGSITGITDLAIADGGTGLSSYTAGDLLYYSSGTALSKLGIGTSNTVLTSSGSAPQWSTSLTLSGSVTATTLIPSGSSAPTNGMYLPTANSVGIATNSTERIRIDSSGNVGIGTSSPAASLSVAKQTTALSGTSQPYGVHIYPTSSGLCYVDALTSSTSNTSLALRTYNNGTYNEMRLDSSGNLLVGTTSGSQKLVVSQSAQNVVSGYFISSNATGVYGIQVSYTGRTPNNTGEEFIYCNDATAARFVVRSNGGLANYSANDVNLSDRREKTNFAPAGEYLSKICAIPVQTFNYIDQNLEEDAGLTLGVVAQDVQAVAPELVSESNWGTKEEPKMRLSIYQTDLQYALMKCIQEQQALITQLTERISALEGKA